MKTYPVKVKKVIYSSDGGYISEKLTQIQSDHISVYSRAMADIENGVSAGASNPSPEPVYKKKNNCRCPRRFKYKCKHQMKIDQLS